MLNTVQALIEHQFEAALCTLNLCIERCPASAWDARVGNHKFCQVVFHTLCYADYYLEKNEQTFREQPFHRANQQFFRDYEELEDRAPRLLYDKPSIHEYMNHCRQKARRVIAAETADSLEGRCGFQRRAFSRAELYVYSIRHIQHHAAQLSLRLRIDSNQAIPWIGSGWCEVVVGA